MLNKPQNTTTVFAIFTIFHPTPIAVALPSVKAKTTSQMNYLTAIYLTDYIPNMTNSSTACVKMETRYELSKPDLLSAELFAQRAAPWALESPRKHKRLLRIVALAIKDPQKTRRFLDEQTTPKIYRRMTTLRERRTAVCLGTRLHHFAADLNHMRYYNLGCRVWVRTLQRMEEINKKAGRKLSDARTTTESVLQLPAYDPFGQILGD